MTISIYNIGDDVDMFGTFRHNDGTLDDPSAVTCVFRDPSGTETVYTYGTDAELARVSLGYFRLRLPITTAGRHFYRFRGTGALAAANELWFDVRPSNFDNP